MASMKDIISSPVLLVMVIIGLLYIVGFSLVYLKKAYSHCLELGISKEDIHSVIKSSLVFSIVPSLSIVVGLFALIAVLGELVALVSNRFFILRIPYFQFCSLCHWLWHQCRNA